jgi:hypothetical protein
MMASNVPPVSEAASEPEPDLEQIVSRWAGESRQLLIALPVVLAKLQELREEREALRNRLMDLEQENLTLRESRESLTETFAKLKDLMAGIALDETQRALVERASLAEPEPPARDAASTPPPRAPVPAAAPAPSPLKPEPRPAPVPEAAPAPPAPGPKPTTQATAEPASPVSGENPAPVRLTPVFRPPTRK